MMPHNTSFRRLLLKYIPELKPEKINQLEDRAAKMHELMEEERMIQNKLKQNPPPQLQNKLKAKAAELLKMRKHIEQNVKEEEIFLDNEEDFDDSLTTYMEARYESMQKGFFIQLPKLLKIFKPIVKSIATFPTQKAVMHKTK